MLLNTRKTEMSTNRELPQSHDQLLLIASSLSGKPGHDFRRRINKYANKIVKVCEQCR